MANYVQPALAGTLGELPLLASLFQPPMIGVGMLTGGIILALMILPYICAVSRDVFRMTPPILKESAYGMGATTWEVTRQVTIPYGLRGIVGATFLGLGRAIGETMAITFVIGNDHKMSTSLFAAGNTISSTLGQRVHRSRRADVSQCAGRVGVGAVRRDAVLPGGCAPLAAPLGTSRGPRR